MTIEISNPPHDLDVTDPSDLSTAELQALATEVINTYQLGELGDVLGKIGSNTDKGELRLGEG